MGILLNQNLALKSSLHVKNAGAVGEWTINLTGPLCPNDSNCFLDAFREFHAHNDVVASSGNIT